MFKVTASGLESPVSQSNKVRVSPSWIPMMMHCSPNKEQSSVTFSSGYIYMTETAQASKGFEV
jgi:hypothetical protein